MNLLRKCGEGEALGKLAVSSVLLLLLFTAGVTEAMPRVVVVGLNAGRSSVNPWSSGLLALKMPSVRPGDFLLFRWFGQMRDVQQFPNQQAYDICDFTRADPVGPRRFFGLDLYLVRKAERGKTLYFGSSVKKECEKGVKAQVYVR
ncbi:hypothetical protein CLOM_g1181 [Closterium sp. NIES-68]|nr:hypothetical protein CLOM_g1181 [Closterium sp. NIES-68]